MRPTDDELQVTTCWRQIRRTLCLLTVFAVLLRAPEFGHLALHIDEQFYLLVGDHMLHGSLPYVDIWDRKPFGLFLIYAAIRLLGGEGFIQYQAVATVFVIATAFVIVRISSRISAGRGPLVAGLAYIAFLMWNGGQGGQSPVFYNLPVALAVLCALRASERPAFDRVAFRRAALSMALFGIALQIKYSPVFEGVYVGAFLLLTAHRRGVDVPKLIGLAILWIGLALLPTLIVTALYWHWGHFDEFAFANFISIFQRSATGDIDVPGRLLKIAVHLAPLLIAAAVSLRWLGERQSARRFVVGWLAAAVGGFVLFGTYHDHYALPLIVPLTVVASSVYGVWIGVGRAQATVGAAVLSLGTISAIGVVVANRLVSDDSRAVRTASNYINAHPPRHLFVFNGDPALYLLAASPIPTPYVFPTLLSERRDASSMGADQMTELYRVMAGRPDYVATRFPAPKEQQPAAWDYMTVELRDHYRRVISQPEGRRQLELYQRIP